jgi:hypothetical protein
VIHHLTVLPAVALDYDETVRGVLDLGNEPVIGSGG